MKITFYSNFLNHHQLPFCKSMYEKLGDNFTFVATIPIPEERINMGYQDMNKAYPFVLVTYESELNKQIALDLALESDIVITGSAPEIYILERILKNKIIFRYSERINKTGILKAFTPKRLGSVFKHHTRYKNKNIYMLCSSGYAAFDFNMLGAYIGKTYKWGYFPETIEYNIDKLIAEKPIEKLKILWTGRFLKWKHPEKAITIASKLRNNGYDFEMAIIGTGELEELLKNLIKKEKLCDYVKIYAPMSPELIRMEMEKSNIFLFTSDYNEGWGAVLNESMNSGCAVVASHAIGAVPFLLEHGNNGMIYKNSCDKDLYLKVENLFNNKELRESISKNAYYTIQNTWNAEKAADRFLKLAQNTLFYKEEKFINGPCSKAESIFQKQMYNKLKKGMK